MNKVRINEFEYEVLKGICEARKINKPEYYADLDITPGGFEALPNIDARKIYSKFVRQLDVSGLEQIIIDAGAGDIVEIGRRIQNLCGYDVENYKASESSTDPEILAQFKLMENILLEHERRKNK